MSQHDYIIDNQLAPAFRSDLNSALAAIVSQNSGVTAPTTTYANMIWYDTTNDLLKMRNEANSAWITLGTIDQSNNVFNPNFLPATQAEAEAGSNNVKGMTALRVAQAIAALNPAAGVNIQVFTSTGTYTPTSGYKYAIGIVTGGGSSGYGSSTSNVPATGGVAGNTVIGSFSISALGAQTTTIGAGGLGVTSGISDGGTSSLGTILSASGGNQTIAYTGLVQIQGGRGQTGTGTGGVGGTGGSSFWGGGVGQNLDAVAYGSGGGGEGATPSTSGDGKSGIVMIMEFK